MAQELTPYQRLGGEFGVRQLVVRFYELMDTTPEAWEIRQMHPASLQGSEAKLFKFLSGWLGGPSLYIEEYGHPRLRMRHFPFAINIQARDQWLGCMNQALHEQCHDLALKQFLQQTFADMATHLLNQPD